jgi:hypothetical protein
VIRPIPERRFSETIGESPNTVAGVYYPSSVLSPLMTENQMTPCLGSRGDRWQSVDVAKIGLPLNRGSWFHFLDNFRSTESRI